MRSPFDVDHLLGKSRDELFGLHSNPTEMLHRFETELNDELPEDFLKEAIPREPNDILVIRGTSAETFSVRSWKEEEEHRDEDFHRKDFVDPPSGTISTVELEDYLGEELQSIVAHEYGACSACDGEPESDCDRCMGETTVECDTCHGAGSTACPVCRGTGALTCPECKGDQYIPCDACDEDGDHLVEDDCPNCSGGSIRSRETCSQCQGQGKLRTGEEWSPCSRCSGGTVTVTKACPECKGQGVTRRRITCQECEGSGTEKCVMCSTTGSVQCQNCDENETVTCRSCDGGGERQCPDCPDGTVICSVCDGDRKTHKIVVRRTFVRPDRSDVEIGTLPHGVPNPDWVKLEPVYLEVETRAGTTVATRTTEVNVDQLEEGRYGRFELEYATVREVTYDYGEQNFKIRELDGELHYTRYPEPKPKGLFQRVRQLF